MTVEAARLLATARDDDDDSELAAYWDVATGVLHVTTADTWPDASRGHETVADPHHEVALGVWRHRAGEEYLVLGVAHDDRGGEPRVVYVRLNRRAGIPVTARRLSDFTDRDVEGPRFRWVGTSQAGPLD
jgi:hypothetical protein